MATLLCFSTAVGPECAAFYRYTSQHVAIRPSRRICARTIKSKAQPPLFSFVFGINTERHKVKWEPQGCLSGNPAIANQQALFSPKKKSATIMLMLMLMLVLWTVLVLDQADRQDGFFQGRLKAFEVWLQFAGASPRVRGEGLGTGSPPDTSGAAAAAADFGPGEGEVDGEEVAQRPLEELPVVLQILLSQVRDLVGCRGCRMCAW